MATFYRSRHELIFAFKVGTAPHTNTFELGQHVIGEVRRQRQFGRPTDQQALLFGEEGVVRPHLARLRWLGSINPQGGPAQLALIYPWQQAGDFFLRGSDLRRWLAGNAIGFSQITTQVPHPLAIRAGMSGDRDARLGPTAEAVRVQRLEVGAFGQNHVQRSALHGRLVQAEGLKQLGGATTGVVSAVNRNSSSCMRSRLKAYRDNPVKFKG